MAILIYLVDIYPIKMRNTFTRFLPVLFFILGSQSFAQNVCNISVTANHNPVCSGSDVILTANGFLQSGGAYNFNFNSGGLPSGWTTTGSTFFSSPCGPSPSGTPYYWAASAGNTTPQITTSALNTTGGGTIDFSFIYSVQGGGQPCEGPDQANEGVSLQYSINNGVSWVDITYFSPGGFQLPANPGTFGNAAMGPTPYTVWNTVSIPIPPAAQTPATMFRWIQFNSSGTCCDNWGLEDIQINSGSSASFQWSTGLSGANANTDTLFNLTQDSCIIVTIADTSGFSCSDTLCIQVIDLAGAVSQVPGCSGLINFSDTSSYAQNNQIAGWNWDFGDGNSSNQQNPSHTYQNYGNYTGTLIITANSGCQDSISFPVTVVDADPLAGFLLPTDCGLTANFTDTSTTPSGPGQITGWNWDFGDGGTSNQQNPSHTYAQPGQWNVTLTVTAANGCTSTSTQQYTNWAYPAAQFSAPSVCDLQAMTFTDQSTVQFSTIADWQWDFNDNGATDQGNAAANHVFSSHGSYSVQLIVTSAEGCSDTVSQSIDIYPLPVPDFTFTEVCEGYTTQLTNQTTIPFGSVPNYTWNLGAGQGSSNATNPTANYPGDGLYPVTLIASSNHGCVDSITKSLTVWPNPEIDWNADPVDGCYPVAPLFNNLTTINTGQVVDWMWTFGDGFTSTQQSPSHSYPNAPGTYDVTLYARSDQGCDTSITKTAYITVRPQPTAIFEYSPETPTTNNPLVQFGNLSDMGESSEWDFGNGETSTENNPTVLYPADTATYWVTLISFNQYGCADTTTRPVTVLPEYSLYIPNAFTPDGDGLNDVFLVRGAAVVEVELDIFNRWGELLHSQGNLEPMKKGWDGTKDGELLKKDTYTYRVRARDIFGEWYEYHGRLHLIR